jgi:hypothetical protein
MALPLPCLTKSDVVKTSQTTPNPLTTASPLPQPHTPPHPAILPPLCRRCALSALSIVHGAIMDRHMASVSSRSDAVIATPARAPLGGGRPHGASAAVVAAAMHRSPLQRPAMDPPSLPGLRRQSGDDDGCMTTLTLIPGAPGALRFATPSSSLSPNVGGVGSWGKLWSVLFGVCVAGRCSELLLAWVGGL